MGTKCKAARLNALKMQQPVNQDDSKRSASPLGLSKAATASGPEVPPDTGFDMVLGSNSEMFARMEAIFKKKELQTLKANFMKVAHDIRMSLIRNIR